MTTFEQLTIDQIDEAALYIATLNSKNQCHIGYCGTEKNDILHDLQEDFIEDNRVNVFISRHDNKINGLIGFDIYEGIAEVWGPFSSEQHLENQIKLWHFATAHFNQIKKFLFFINKENTFQQHFMQTIDAEKSSDELYLKLSKQTFQPVKAILSERFKDEDYEQFKMIHTHAFPNTYYSAKTIVEKLHNPNNQLIILKEDCRTKGYAYFEMNDDLYSTHLEYIAIAPEYRGQGFGKQLLSEALTLIFENKAITQVTLTVNGMNVKANSLYYQTGFENQHALLSYVLKR